MSKQPLSSMLICLLSIYFGLVNDSAIKINLLETSRYYFSTASAASNNASGNGIIAGAGKKMTTITVGTAAQLQTALSQAHAGDTILLQAGTYSALSLSSLNFSTNVTITSADSTHPATLTGVVLSGCSGLSFTNLDFDGSSTPANSTNYAFRILSSSNITFDHLHIHGSMDGNPQDDVQVLAIKNSNNVTISNSEFEQLGIGMGYSGCTNLTITNNSFHDIRTDGIRGSQSSYVNITNNEFTNFYPVSGDHADAIQMWTTGTTAASHDINISGNLVYQGTSGYVMQGVFMRDELGTMPFKNVTIHDNVMVGTNWNAIAVIGGVDVDVANNIAAQLPGQEQNPLIRIENVVNATLENNHSDDYQFMTPVTETGDVKIDPTATDITNYLNAWFAAHPSIGSVGPGTTSTSGTGTTGTTTDSGGTTTGGTTTGSTTDSGGTTTGGTTTGSTTDSGGTTTPTHGKGSTKWGPHSKVVQTSLVDHSDTVATTSMTTKTTTTSATSLKLTTSSDDFVFASKHEGSLGFIAHLTEIVATHGLPVAYAQHDFLASPEDMQFEHVWAHIPDWHLLS